MSSCHSWTCLLRSAHGPYDERDRVHQLPAAQGVRDSRTVPRNEGAYKLLNLPTCNIEVLTDTGGKDKEKKLIQRESNNQHWKKALNQLASVYLGCLPDPSRNHYATCHLHSGLDTLNGNVESFHSRQREESLNSNASTTVLQARVAPSNWHHDCNHVRRHSSLSYKTPTEHDENCTSVTRD